MPPIQWEKLRQIREALLKSSTLSRILAPVVVNPETISKSASSKRVISPPRRKGMQPNRLRIIQPRDTVTNPSRAKKTLLAGFLRTQRKPINPQAAATAR